VSGTLKLAQWETRQYKISQKKRKFLLRVRTQFGFSAAVSVIFVPAQKPLAFDWEATFGHRSFICG